MGANSFGRYLTMTTFGESHGPALGLVLDGLPPGLALDLAALQLELDRRRPGQSRVTSARREADLAEILSGLYDGRTTGAPLAMIFRNEDQDSSAYLEQAELFRPGHADYAFEAKYGLRDPRGGGRSSGRETVARVAAGAVARQILGPHGVKVLGWVDRVADVSARDFDPAAIFENPVRCPDGRAAALMQEAIEAARASEDSVGGIVRVRAEGVPAGLGDPIFCKLDGMIGLAMLSIGGVRAVEIGDGWAMAAMKGSEANDALGPKGYLSNHSGGLNGGVSNGAPIEVTLAVKPTSSIGLPQETIDLRGAPRTIRVKGRHDPCLCPRVVPVAEAMLAFCLADALLAQRALGREPSPKGMP
ncbi:MAG: chorismate synthase [Polyangia bacterium]|nr:chorismate synthase [Polyangia bacterium]